MQKIRKLKWDIDFAELAIKGRGVKGNLVSKFPIRKIELKSEGVSTLAARKIWFDDSVHRLNVDGRGSYLGAFKGEDKILTINQSGHYKLVNFDLSAHFDDDMIHIGKWNPESPMAAIYWEGAKERFYVKRFLLENSDKKELFISESSGSYLELISLAEQSEVDIHFKKVKGKERDSIRVNLQDFISVKGMKALGNQLTSYPVKDIQLEETAVDVPDETKDEEAIERSESEDKDDETQNQITLEL